MALTARCIPSNYSRFFFSVLFQEEQLWANMLCDRIEFRISFLVWIQTFYFHDKQFCSLNWCFFRFANLEWYFHITTTIRSALCLILFWINFFYSHSVPSCMTYINCVQLSLAFFHEVLTLPFTQSIASRQFVFTKIYGHYTNKSVKFYLATAYCGRFCFGGPRKIVLCLLKTAQSNSVRGILL